MYWFYSYFHCFYLLYFINQPPKTLQKNILYTSKWSYVFPEINFWFNSKQNMIFFQAFFEVSRQNTEKYQVHCATSCKITAPMDKNCGNKSKIMFKICLFLPPKLLTQKHVNLSNYLDTSGLFFVCRTLLRTHEQMSRNSPQGKWVPETNV